MRKWFGPAIVVLLLAAGVVLLLMSATELDAPMQAAATATPSLTPEPIVPTRTVAAPEVALSTPAPTATTAVPSPTATITSTSGPTPTATITPTSGPVAAAPEFGAIDELSRFGVAGSVLFATAAQEAGLPFGAFLTWNTVADPPSGFEFWQMVRVDQNGIRRTTWEYIETAVAANPGSYWLVGNEPDVRWQDNVTPERYAEIYHDVHTFIKERDPTAKLVIGGVSQPTPLRRAYLDRILDTYRANYGTPMPIDVWNVHAFVLREEAGSWGVGIPPGMDGETGILYEIEDHDDLDIFAQNLIDFRAWMSERGYGDRPLVITEYGILLPNDYGFPPEAVADFMTGTFDFFLTAANDTGYAPDGNRLVQWWFWFSLFDDGQYPTGDLYERDTGQLTPLGEAWQRYLGGS